MNRRLKLTLLILVGAAAIIASQIRLVPGCTNHNTIDLVRSIITNQFKLPHDVKLSNIRTISGWYFGSRYECAAELSSDDPSFKLLKYVANQVTYSSEITDDTHRQYVTAKLGQVLE
jgi:hypothetical protein